MINNDLSEYVRDVNYYALDGESLVTYKKVSDIPDDLFDNDLAMKRSEALKTVQMYSARSLRTNIHESTEPNHLLALELTRRTVEEYGETFDVLYRGDSSGRSLDDRKVCYAATDPEVAAFYGEVLELKNVKGLRTVSGMRSVLANEETESFLQDEEVIFFP